MTDFCTFLPWDSDFFGFRIARYNHNRMDLAAANEVDSWCREESIRCVYFLAAPSHPESTIIAERAGYHLADIRLTLEQGMVEKNAPGRAVETIVKVRPARQQDLPALKTIARANFTLSRFYFDPGFPRSRCDALYEVWIEKSCSGYADIVLVAEFEGQPIGFITAKCDRTGSQTGEIGLLGIDASAQGRGVGGLLVENSLGWFAEQGMKIAEVVTQGRNVRAQRLYQRAGFVTKAVQLWYHKWFMQ